VANPLQEHVAEVLLDKIQSDKHPSTTHMNMFESIAPPRLLAMYVLHLTERIENEPYPSIPMMQRVIRLAPEFGD
jgi:hypothetical protein